jgi:hypothetical protein
MAVELCREHCQPGWLVDVAGSVMIESFSSIGGAEQNLFFLRQETGKRVIGSLALTKTTYKSANCAGL